MKKSDNDIIQLLTTRIIDSNNRVAIPKQARRILNLNPNDEVVFKYQNNVLSLEKKLEEKKED